MTTKPRARDGRQWLLIELGRMPEPTKAQVQVFSFLSWALLSLDALLGILVLRGRLREAMTSSA